MTRLVNYKEQPFHNMTHYLIYPVDAPVQDRFLEGLLATLIHIGPKNIC